jgi:putative SOS response-associated peptidase YedK
LFNSSLKTAAWFRPTALPNTRQSLILRRKRRTSFALNDDRPLFAFDGIWTEVKVEGGPKSEPIPGPHLIYGFLTTASNSMLEPSNPRPASERPGRRNKSAMYECARLEEAKLQRSLPGDALKI